MAEQAGHRRRRRRASRRRSAAAAQRVHVAGAAAGPARRRTGPRTGWRGCSGPPEPAAPEPDDRPEPPSRAAAEAVAAVRRGGAARRPERPAGRRPAAGVAGRARLVLGLVGGSWLPVLGHSCSWCLSGTTRVGALPGPPTVRARPAPAAVAGPGRRRDRSGRNALRAAPVRRVPSARVAPWHPAVARGEHRRRSRSASTGCSAWSASPPSAASPCSSASSATTTRARASAPSTTPPTPAPRPCWPPAPSGSAQAHDVLAVAVEHRVGPPRGRRPGRRRRHRRRAPRRGAGGLPAADRRPQGRGADLEGAGVRRRRRRVGRAAGGRTSA